MSYASTNRIHDKAAGWSDAASEAVEHSMQAARETVASNPTTAVMAAFGAGLGVGICLALAIGGRTPPPMDYGLREKLSQLFGEHIPWMRT
jgi:hypothetical protein